MSAIVEEKPKEYLVPSKLERKPFFWDNIIFSLASTIFVLSVSSVVVELFKSQNYSLACFSELENRAQYTYINSYCNKYLPVIEYFPVALVIHAAALTTPHYLWKAFFSAQFESFFSHADKVETLREGNAGKYPRKNYIIADYLQREFGNRKIILTGYIAKLTLQLFLVLIALAVNAAVFTDINFDITFECYDNNERSQLFGNVTCAYPRKLFINVLQVADYLILVVAVMVLGFSLYWSLLYNHSTEDEIAQFCYDSSIDAKFYKPSKKRLSWHQKKDDFKFLLASLLATNSGLRRVFKTILIENMISQKFSAHLESLRSFDSFGHHMLGNNQMLYEHHFRHYDEDSTSFGDLMYDLCEVISKDLEKAGHNTSKLTAMDIAGCDHHSYMFGIARWHLQAISIIMDNYYENKKEGFADDNCHSGVMLLKIPINLFELPGLFKMKFSEKISDFIGLTNNDTDCGPVRFSLIVVGPLNSQRKHNVVNQIVEMHSRSNHYFIQGAVMLIIKPIAVDNVDISGDFNDWKPEAIPYWRESSILNARSDWPKHKSLIHTTSPNSCVVNVKCGESHCKFQLTTYQYHNNNGLSSLADINTYEQDDTSLRPPSSNNSTLQDDSS